jgi:Ca-activated chloride channel homolog
MASALGADGLGVRQKLAVLLLLPSLVLASPAAGPDPLIRKRVSEVQFTLVATDQDNRPLPRLSPADILVLEDGQPVPRFELQSAADLPLRIGIVLDLSDSTLKSWAVVRDSLLRSLQTLMRPDDTLLVVTFNSKIQVERTLDVPDQLAGTLQNPPVGGLTALYDTLYRECGHPLFSAGQEPHRSALILFSDGEDDLSLHGASEAIARAQRNGIAIYTVNTHSPKQHTAGDLVLHDFAETTGGRDFIAKDEDQLQAALTAINDELRGSYLLYYRVAEQSGAGSFRRVRVVSTQNEEFRMRSRKGYYTAP